jgi:GTP cyclohydrolase I
MDREAMERAVARFVEAIGERFDGDDLDRTPERVAKAWYDDLLSGYRVDPDRELTWTAVPHRGGAVAVRDLRFASVCVHHLLPFFGFAQIAYLPGERLAGLSKLGRVVDAHARRLQIQERLTSEGADTVDRVLRPRGVLVRLEAEHTCMTLRGVRKEGSRLTTVAARGLYDTDPGARREVLDLLATRPSSLDR